MATFRNPVLDGGPNAGHGDPFVLQDAGRYVLVHTGGTAVPAYESSDLVHWQRRGDALRAAAPPHGAQVDLWAPEVLRDGDRLFMYVAATRLRPDGRGVDAARRIWLARATDPLGPFAWDPQPLVTDPWSIDAHPHRGSDGRLWLYYTTRTKTTRGPGGRPGSGNVVDRLVAVDRVEGRPSTVVVPTARWEANAEGTAYWTEAPWVLERRGGQYQMYSGSLYSEPGYSIGGALAPAPGGRWVKDAANPTFRGTTRIQGPGHNCVVRARDGVTPYAVYHGRLGARPGRKVHIDRLWWVGDRPLIAGGRPPTHPTHAPQPVPPAAAFDRDVATWRVVVWVRGGRLTVANAPVALHDAQLRQVDVHRGLHETTVRVDGVLVERRSAAGDGAPALAPADAIVSSAVTSCLQDDAMVTLAEGATRTWPWGGRRPLEVALAVRGQAELRAGSSRRTARAPRDEARLAVLLSPTGADVIEVRAGRGGAVVSDVVAVCRDESEAQDIAAACDRWSAA